MTYSRRTLKWSIILAKRFEKSSVFRAVNDNSEQWFCRNETDRTGEDSNLLGNVELNPNCEPECSECFFKKSTSAPCCGRVAWKLFVRKSWICDLRDQQPGCFAQHGCVALRRTLANTNNTFLEFSIFQKQYFFFIEQKRLHVVYQRHRRKEFTEKDKCDRTPLKTTTHWLEHELYFSSFFKQRSVQW